MEAKFKGEWCKNNVFADVDATMQWHFIVHPFFFDPTIT